MKRTPPALTLILLVIGARAWCAPDDLDASFGVDGLRVFEDYHYLEWVSVSAHALPNGELIVGDGGWLRRVSADGKRADLIDVSSLCAIDPVRCFPIAVALQADGKLVFTFNLSRSWASGRIGIARVGIDGSPDSGFGSGGATILTSSRPFSPSQVFVQPDGGILVVGGSEERALARFHASGQPDTQFGDGGILYLDGLGEGPMLQTTSGLLLLANRERVVRMSASGQIDATFTAHAALPRDFTPRALTEQADGKIVVAGIVANKHLADLAVVRFTTEGHLDGSFGQNGLVVLPIDQRTIVPFVSTSVDSKARIVVAATVAPIQNFAVEKHHRVAVARLLADGTPDIWFAGNGVTTVLTSRAAKSQHLVITVSDAILIGATFDYGWVYPGLIRLTGGEGLVARAVAEARAIEYFHAELGHYFVTASPVEISTLDPPARPYEQAGPWQRTGRSFRVWTGDAPSLTPVCRFFSGQTFGSLSSHFYTPHASECELLRSSSTWTFEGEAFRLQLASTNAAGAWECPAGSAPLYRAYNNGLGGAPNHRYTDEPAVLAAMIGQGWVFEGDAQTKVFACIPPQ